MNITMISNTSGSTLNTSAMPPNSLQSLRPGDEPQLFVEPEALKIFRFFIYAVIIFFALIGNVAVCVVSRRNRRLQTSTYCLIMNLAVSDIGSVLCLPFLLPELFVGNWMMGEVMCKLLKPSVVLLNFVTTNTLVAIASDRFRAVVFPLAARPSTSETRLILSVLWLIAFLFSLPSYGAMTVTSLPGYPDYYFCLDVFSDNSEKDTLYRRIYTVTMYIVQAVSPALVISVLYLKITATLKHFSLVPLVFKPFRSSSLSSTPNASPRSSIVNVNKLKLNMNAAGFLKRQVMEKKFLRMLMTVLVVYVLCYLPYQTFYLVYEFHPELFTGAYMQPLSEFMYLTVWLPNALNPICYGCMNEHYKRAFKALIFHPRRFIHSLRSRQSFSHSGMMTTLSKKQAR